MLGLLPLALGPGGVAARAGPDTIYCRGPVPLRGEGLRTVADFTVDAGQRLGFTPTWAPTTAASAPEPLASRCTSGWAPSRSGRTT